MSKVYALDGGLDELETEYRSVFGAAKESRMSAFDEKFKSPVGAFDAMVWAESFKEVREDVLKKSGRDIADDEGSMLGWFANAIMAGYDEKSRRTENGES